MPFKLGIRRWMVYVARHFIWQFEPNLLKLGPFKTLPSLGKAVDRTYRVPAAAVWLEVDAGNVIAGHGGHRHVCILSSEYLEEA
jgi:hypothetical protein